MAHRNQITAPGELVEMGRDLDRGIPRDRREGDGGAHRTWPRAERRRARTRSACRAGRRAFDPVGTGSAQSGAGPSANRATLVPEGAATSTTMRGRAAPSSRQYRLDGDRRTLAESSLLRYPRCGRGERGVVGGGRRRAPARSCLRRARTASRTPHNRA